MNHKYLIGYKIATEILIPSKGRPYRRQKFFSIYSQMKGLALSFLQSVVHHLSLQLQQRLDMRVFRLNPGIPRYSSGNPIYVAGVFMLWVFGSSSFVPSLVSF
jgi:hypothetical protein